MVEKERTPSGISRVGSSSPDGNVTPKIVKEINSLIEIKRVAPGSERHSTVIQELLDILTSTPGALEVFKALENGNK